MSILLCLLTLAAPASIPVLASRFVILGPVILSPTYFVGSLRGKVFEIGGLNRTEHVRHVICELVVCNFWDEMYICLDYFFKIVESSVSPCMSDTPFSHLELASLTKATNGTSQVVLAFSDKERDARILFHDLVTTHQS